MQNQKSQSNRFTGTLIATASAILLAGTIMSANLYAEATETRVPVIIENIQTERGGDLLVMLFRRDGFPVKHDRALSIRKIPANTKTARVNIPIPAEGEEFAIKILHDQDRNGKVTKNFIGIPAEGLGFSSGAALNFGPPKFKAARIARADAGKVQRIRLQYL